MSERIKSLNEVSEEIGEKIGEFKQFNATNGFFKMSLRGEKDIKLYESKIRANLSFKGTKQPISFGYFKSKTGYNNKYKNKKEYANHYGEYIAYIILKQLGKKACKVDIGELEIKNPYNSKPIQVEGILSHFQLTQEEIFQPISVIIEHYKSVHPKKYRDMTARGKTHSDKNYTNVELILNAIEEAFRKNEQEYKISDARKKFFDMCIFDIIFANRDRHDENFGLKINQMTNEMDFYHLFDNEQILGFQENRPDIKKYLDVLDTTQYEKFKDRELTSCIGIPENIQRINSQEFLMYLLEHYPEETIDSLKDISRYKLEDLEELMSVFPNLSKEHKEFASKIFADRQQEIVETVKRFRENKTPVVPENPDEGVR